MMELYGLYISAFILCFMASMVLSIQGSYLVAKNESLQLLGLAQAALLGNLLGTLIFQDSPIGSLIGSIVLFAFFKAIFQKQKDINEPFYVVIYLFLLSLCYFLITLFPMLNGHLSVGFFGDIVSLETVKVNILIVLFFFFLLYFVFTSKKRIKSVVNKSLFGMKGSSLEEELLFSLVLILSLYGLGLLFSLSYLIFPIVILGRSFSNHKKSLFFLSLLSACSSVIGLAFSIQFTNLSTVPSQVILLFFGLVFLKLLRS